MWIYSKLKTRFSMTQMENDIMKNPLFFFMQELIHFQGKVGLSLGNSDLNLNELIFVCWAYRNIFSPYLNFLQRYLSNGILFIDCMEKP